MSLTDRSPSGTRHGRRAFLGLTAGTAGLALAGCAPGGSSTPSTSSKAPAAVTTDASSMGDVSLKVMDTWVDKTSMQAQWILKVNAAFTSKYPNIKIKRSTATFDDVNKTLKLKLSDPSAPDVVPANNGWQGIGTYAKSKLILNLDPYAEAYGWTTRIPKTIAMQHQVTTDGSQIGTGSFYGMPISQGGFITIYYSRAKLRKLDLEVPKTFDDFTAALAAAKKGGEVPMMIGTQDQWLSTTTLFAVMDAYADKDKIANFVYGSSGTAADTGMKEATTIYQEWAKKGYLPKNFAGTPGSDAGQHFVDGDGLFYFYYSDSLPFKTTATGNKFGTFLLPTQGPLQATGATNQNFSIAANSKHADAAALYLDFVSSQQAGEIALETGVMPFNGKYTAPDDAGALLQDEVGELNAIAATDGFIPYFDWASPTMLTTLGAKCQQLLAGRTTPDEVVKACQDDYDAFRTSQGK